MTQPTNIPASSNAQRPPLTFDATLAIRTPSDPQITADGRFVAFTLAEWPHDQSKPRQRIWLVETDGNAEPHPFTNGPKGDSSPTWSPDGRWLAFISERGEADKGHAQLYVQPAEGGDARRVCLMPNGAASPRWSPDGSRIAFLSHEGAEHASGPKVNEEPRHTRLWTVRPASDTAEPVTPPDHTIWRYAWSPDSSRFAVFSSTGPAETDWYRGQLGLVPSHGGAVRQITRLTRQAEAPTWSRDGRTLYFILGEWSDRGLVGGDVCALPIDPAEIDQNAKSGKSGNLAEPRNLTPGIEISISWLHELEDGRLLYAAWDHLANSVGLLDPATGETTPLTTDFWIADGACPRLSTTPDGSRFVAIHCDASHPLDLWLGELNAKNGKNGNASSPADTITWRQRTRMNPLAEETLTLAPSRRIAYEGADGWRIEGFFTPPLDARRGTPPPLVLFVHGGPTSAYRESYLQTVAISERTVQLLAAAGFAVLWVNPRGSIGRGVAFADAVLGDPGGKDYEELMRGVDYVVAQGWADGDRTGIFGWSYGGFMTAWTVTQTPRFKAAVMGAGVCDFHSFHAQSNIPDWDMRVLAADPLERPDWYRQRSAITFAARVATPTLILHGEADPSVPVNQAYAFYRALRERDVPAELAVYPGEGHGVRDREHLRDLFARLLRWFEAYL
jgi:dipeptidyl aminopeptidase/acylaminoacyl peptidase